MSLTKIIIFISLSITNIKTPSCPSYIPSNRHCRHLSSHLNINGNTRYGTCSGDAGTTKRGEGEIEGSLYVRFTSVDV